MRYTKEISTKKENFRLEPLFDTKNNQSSIIKRDPIKSEPEGTIILKAFRIIGYDQDCDGSLMARIENINFTEAESTGWEESGIGLYPESTIVITEEELKTLVK